MESLRKGTAKVGDVVALGDNFKKIIFRTAFNNAPKDRVYMVDFNTPEHEIKRLQREAKREDRKHRAARKLDNLA